MVKDLILTCDAGTSSVKCSLFTADGRVVNAVRGEYETIFPRPGWAEQSPEVIRDAVIRSIRLLLNKGTAGRVACVGLSGTMNGCIPVDEDGKALHNNIIHSDSRAYAEINDIARIISPADFYRLTGNRLDNHYTLPKILWLGKHHPEILRKTRWWLNTKDYLYGCLTGRFGFTDYSDASLTIALDIKGGCWAEDMLHELGVDISHMPEILPGHDVSGCISPEAAQLTGLPAGTPVAIGGGDGSCSARGAGLARPGSAYACLGSSSWVSQMTDAPVIDREARVFNYLDMDGKSNHVCGTIQCGGDAFNWAAEHLLSGGAPLSEGIPQAEELARDVAPGAEGVYFLPTLMGERTPYWDPNTRGCLTGFTLYHHRGHIARAVYEGVAYALLTCANVMRECGLPVQDLMLTGGGAKSRLWPDILASAFGIETKVHSQPAEATSLGAAIAAGVGVGLFGGYEDAAKMVSARSVHPVNPDWAAEYTKRYPVYSKLYDRLKPLFDEIAQQ